MQWEKIGRIFNPLNYDREDALISHASNPTVLKLRNELVRVFYSGRDKNNRSSVGAFDFNMKTLTVEKVFTKSLFRAEKNKSFFRDGVSVSTVIKIKSVNYLYFMGWQNPKKEHWRGDIGRLKIEKNGSLTLDSLRPVITKNIVDKISVSYPWIIKSKNGLLNMWYGSTITWDAGNNEMLHVINYSTSYDGINWSKKGQVIDSKIGHAQAFSRPTVYESENSNHHMWFSYRSGLGTSYRLGYAYKKNYKNVWDLKINQSGIDVSSEGWDSEMIAYPCIHKYRGKIFMFYNGNGFGKTGIGLAIANDIE